VASNIQHTDQDVWKTQPFWWSEQENWSCMYLGNITTFIHFQRHCIKLY